MRITIFILSIFCFSNSLFSQLEPAVFIEDYNILDVFVQDDMTYYATRTNIVQVDSENNETILNDDFSLYLKGRFYDQPDGWVYVGSQYLDIDIVLPFIVLEQWDGNVLENESISLLDVSFARHLAVSFQSMDSVFILTKDSNQFQIFRVNSDSDVLETINLEMNNLIDMELLEDNINILIGEKALYSIAGDQIIDQVIFDDEIVDWKIYREKERIEVLTKTEVLELDFSFNQIRAMLIPQSEREPKAIYSYENITYLIETIENQSYILTLDSLGSVLEEYQESPEILYDDLHVGKNSYKVWGRNKCNISGNLIKIDADQFQSEIPYSDLELEELETFLEGVTIDTVELSNGDFIYPEYLNYSWELIITNNGDEMVNNYKVNSYKMQELGPEYISFNSQDPLAVGESRIHEGEFRLNKNGSYVPYGFAAWVGTDSFDAYCEDNKKFTELATSVKPLNPYELNIYPNPANEFISVNTSSTYSYRIFDVNGKLLRSKKDCLSQKIDLAEISSGLYILEVLNEGNRYRKKFVKN